LSEANNEKVIKEAFEIVKPYYFSMIQRRVAEETRKVHDAFKIESTQHAVLFYYLFNTQHAEIRTAPIIQRLQTFNENRDKDQYL
jgi:hypothetical protein